MSQWSKDKNTSVIKWLNESSILQDLSAVQGRVPVKIEGTALRAGEKPPALNIKEETEEEFFRQCAGDGEVPTAPDLSMIQHMLAMVRDVSPKLDDEACSDKPLLITKPNSISKPHKPNQTPKNDENTNPLQFSSKEGKKKLKRQRNCAMELLLQALADKNKTEQTTACSEGTVLRKPDDFLTVSVKPVHTEEIVRTHNDSIATQQATVKKVTDWLDTPKSSPFPKITSKVCLDSSSLMFKKKSVGTEKVKSGEKSKISPTSNGKEYKPSAKANEYYQKYVEQNKIRESVREDIWARAEREMKELDEKRRLAAEVCKQSAEETQDSVELATTFAKREIAPGNEAALSEWPSVVNDPAVIITEESFIDQKTCAEHKLMTKDDAEAKQDDQNIPENDGAGQIVSVENVSEMNNRNHVDSSIVVAQLIDIEEPNVFQESLISVADELEKNMNSGDDDLTNDVQVKLCDTCIFDIHENDTAHFVEHLDC